MSLPEGRAGQGLALGLLGLVLLATWLGLGGPLLEAHAERAAVLERKALVAARMQALVASLPALQASAAALPAGQGQAGLLGGASDALAGATLQGMVQELAARSGGVSLESLEALPAEEMGGYRRIGLRVAGKAPWPNLLRLLQLVDATSPGLLVDALSLRGPPPQRGLVGVPVEVSFAVYGFREATP